MAGDKVLADPRVADVPCMATEREQVNSLFLSCAITRSKAKAEKAAQVKSRRNESSNVSSSQDMMYSHQDYLLSYVL